MKEQIKQKAVADLYRRVLEFTGNGVYRYTFRTGRILTANQGFADILNLDCRAEDLPGRHLKDVLIYTEKQGKVRRALAKTGAIRGFEYRFKTLKGEEKWVLHDSFVAADPETGERVVDAIVRDITVQKHAEEALSRERERLAVTLRSIGDGVIATDTAGCVVLLNQAAETLTGWREKDAQGKPLEEVFRLLHEGTRKPVKAPVDRALGQGKTAALPARSFLLSRDGTERAISDSIAPIHGTDGQVLGAVLVFRDVTDRRRLDDFRRKSDKLAAIGSLAGSVAHGFGSMAGVIKGYAAAIAETVNPRTSAHDNASRIIDLANRAGELTRRLKDLSAGDEAKAQLEPVSLAQAVRSLRGMMEPVFPQKDIQFEVKGEEAMPFAWANPKQIADALMYIALNSYETVPNGGRVRIDVYEREIRRPDSKLAPHAKPGPYVVLRVRDTGVRTATDVSPHLSDLLFSSEETPSTTRFGLAVAQGMVQHWGGWIAVRAEPDKGSTLRVYMRKARAALPAQPEAQSVAAGQMLLLIDDNEEVLASMKKALESARYQVVTANNAEDAVALFKRRCRDISLAVVDLLLPDTQESFVLREMLQHAPDARVVVVSGFSRDYVRQHIPFGVWSFLQKPFDDQQLVGTVDSILRPSTQDAGGERV